MELSRLINLQKFIASIAPTPDQIIFVFNEAFSPGLSPALENAAKFINNDIINTATTTNLTILKISLENLDTSFCTEPSGPSSLFCNSLITSFVGLLSLANAKDGIIIAKVKIIIKIIKMILFFIILTLLSIFVDIIILQYKHLCNIIFALTLGGDKEYTASDGDTKAIWIPKFNKEEGKYSYGSADLYFRYGNHYGKNDVESPGFYVSNCYPFWGENLLNTKVENSGLL